MSDPRKAANRVGERKHSIFTDDDLRRVTEELDWDTAERWKLEALLYRLKAAENFMKNHQNHTDEKCNCEAKWRKVAGK